MISKYYYIQKLKSFYRDSFCLINLKLNQYDKQKVAEELPTEVGDKKSPPKGEVARVRTRGGIEEV